MAFFLVFIKFRILSKEQMEAEFLKNNTNEFKNSEQFFEQTVSAKDHHMLCVCNVTLQRVTRYLRNLALMTLRCFHLSGYSPEFIFGGTDFTIE